MRTCQLRKQWSPAKFAVQTVKVPRRTPSYHQLVACDNCDNSVIQTMHSTQGPLPHPGVIPVRRVPIRRVPDRRDQLDDVQLDAFFVDFDYTSFPYENLSVN